MNETESYSTYLARERFAMESEASSRRISPGRSSRKVTNWCIQESRRKVQEGPVMDLACGNGRHLSQWSESAVPIFAGDLSLPMLRHAMRSPLKKGRLTFTCLEAERLPFKANSFEVTFSARFLHHLPTYTTRERVLGEMFRVSRKAVAVTFKARWTPEHFKHLLKYFIRKQKPHRYFCGRSELQRIASKHGWQVTGSYAPWKCLSANQSVLFEPKTKPAR